ncbi:hypothetical protein Peur_043599 [Populus x canadensis]
MLRNYFFSTRFSLITKHQTFSSSIANISTLFFLQNLLQVTKSTTLLNGSQALFDRESSAHYQTRFFVEITRQAKMIVSGS